VKIVNDESSVVSKRSFKFIDDPRVIIHDHHRFTIQATGKKDIVNKNGRKKKYLPQELKVIKNFAICNLNYLTVYTNL
jgi:hypothetical protein